jgi:hypothetical protein
MSEADTSSTSSRKRRSQLTLKAELQHGGPVGLQHYPGKDALPIVRTPSKTLERPLGLVFLVYRGETKRAVLPNEITSLDTVKALFVRSFTKTLTMEYMDTPRVHIYIHDSSKDIFYELEDLAEIRDRTVVKLFEVDSSGRGPSGLGPSGLPPITNADEEAAAAVASMQQLQQHNIAEPEYVDSKHVKAMKVLNRVQREYEMAMGAGGGHGPGTSSTLPRNTFSSLEHHEKLAAAMFNNNNQVPGLSTNNTRSLTKSLGGPGFMRGHSSSKHQQVNNSNRVESGYVSSPDGNFDMESSLRGRGQHGGGHGASNASSTGNVIIPSRFSALPGGRYYPRPESTEEAKARMMHMEAQLSQLTGMVEKALKNKKLGKKTVSFDRAVQFSDDPQPQQGILVTNKLKQQQPLAAGLHNHIVVNPGQSGDHPDQLYLNLRRLHRSARDLKQEVKVLRRLTQLQSMAMKDLVQDTYIKLREACISFSTSQSAPILAANSSGHDPELWRLAQDEETFTKELNELVQSIGQLEAKVEETRSGVINKKNKISLVDVESMAFTLSRGSKTVTLLKQAFPTLEASIKALIQVNPVNPDRRRMTEDFVKRTPDRMENIWRRCKKLTGTLVTLKRLASVQEQRFHPGALVDVSLSPTPSEIPPLRPNTPSQMIDHHQNGGGSLDDLLDSLQTYNGAPAPSSSSGRKNSIPQNAATLPKATNSHNNESPAHKTTRKTRPSSSEIKGSDKFISDLAPAAAAPKTNGTAVLTAKTVAPPPPPRSSSAKSNSSGDHHRMSMDITDTSSTSTSSESVNSQEGTISLQVDTPQPSQLRKTNSLSSSSSVTSSSNQPPPVAAKPTNVDIKGLTAKARQDALEQRHQELLARQKQLQEQYQRLQVMQQKKDEQQSSNNSTNSSSSTAAAVAITTTNGSSTSSLSSTSSSVSTDLTAAVSKPGAIEQYDCPAPGSVAEEVLPRVDTEISEETTDITVEDIYYKNNNTNNNKNSAAPSVVVVAVVPPTPTNNTTDTTTKRYSTMSKSSTSVATTSTTSTITAKVPPAVPMRTISSLSSSVKAPAPNSAVTTTTLGMTTAKDKKVYETDII